MEVAAGLALAVVAVRASSGWELAALIWLALFAVPLAFIDIAVRRLPAPLTAAGERVHQAQAAVGQVSADLRSDIRSGQFDGEQAVWVGAAAGRQARGPAQPG